MNICIIGSSGHVPYVLRGLKGENDVYITGIAPGSVGENMDGLDKKVAELGFSHKRYDDYCQMLDELKPDIAVVNCFFGDHFKAASEALKRGCHLFVEKPIATELDDLYKLREIYEKSGVHLAAMFGIRYTSHFLTAWEAVKNGAIGEVRLMNAQKSYKLGVRGENYRNRKTYGGTIPWVGSHAIDWLY